MYLLIDAGNSRLKFACHDGHNWLVQAVADSVETLSARLPEGFVPAKAIVSCVGTPAVRDALHGLLDDLHIATEWLSATSSRCGLHCGYADPAQLGPDRWAAAIGAWQLTGADCLVVSAGTATTVDVVRIPGLFAGGIILPGLSMMHAALAQGTAALPRVADIAPQGLDLTPTDTHTAIAVGCLHAQLGAIERMAAQLPAGSPILLSGGNAQYLAPLLQGTIRLKPWLVMQGLLAIAAETTAGGF